MAATPSAKPAMDAELRAGLRIAGFPPLTTLNAEKISQLRVAATAPPNFLERLRARGFTHDEVRVEVPSADGEGSTHEILLSVLQRARTSSSTLRPWIYWMHGGGYHWGDRFHTSEYVLDLVLECNAVCVSVEYRLAPEHCFSAAVEDCYAGVCHASQHARELGLDPARLIVGGVSAGGGLAAATVLRCRDRAGPPVSAQLLICPALDDRLASVSFRQYTEPADFLTSGVIGQMWASTRAKESPERRVAAPGSVEDLSRLPTAYVDVGSAEVLRDETVAYASRLWECGVQAELHVWPGGFHGFDILVPHAGLSLVARKAKIDWAKRIWGRQVR